MKVLNIGSCNIDYIYEVDHMVRPGETQKVDTLEIVSGGKGLNQSIALAKAGVDVYHAGLIGRDGSILRQALEGHGANTDYLSEVDGPSGHAIIQLDKHGENCILVYPGANHQLTEELIEEILSHFESGDLLLLQNEVNNMPFIVKRAHGRIKIKYFEFFKSKIQSLCKKYKYLLAKNFYTKYNRCRNLI